MCTEFDLEFFDFISWIITCYVFTIDKTCGSCFMKCCCGKNKTNNTFILQGRILCLRLLIQWVFGFGETCVLNALVWSSHFNGTFTEMYDAGRISFRTIVCLFGDYGVLGLIILIACQICLCKSKTTTSARLYFRKVIFKLIMFLQDIFAFLLTLFLDLDVGESLIDTSSWLPILLFVCFILESCGLIIDILQLIYLLRCNIKSTNRVSAIVNQQNGPIPIAADNRATTSNENQIEVETLYDDSGRERNDMFNENEQQRTVNIPQPSYVGFPYHGGYNYQYPYSYNHHYVGHPGLTEYVPPSVPYTNMQGRYP